MKDFFKQIFTDAAGRPEIKMILGVPTFFTGIIYGIVALDWIGFGALVGTALTMMGITAYGDAAIDRARIMVTKKPKDPETDQPATA